MAIKLTTNEAISRCKITHGDKYDYSSSLYVNADTKLKIICKVHGEFLQRYSDHVKGRGCSKCGGVAKLDTTSFIAKAVNIHGDKYDYSKVCYVNTETPITITCFFHGEFFQTPHQHLQGQGCSECGKAKTASSHLLSHGQFLEKAKKIHGSKYLYLVEYVNQHQHIKILCNTHGEFCQKPKEHLRGNGCPVCKESHGEREIRKILDLYEIKYLAQHSFDECRNVNRLYFDFYLPDKNVCVEFDGRQHFIPIKKWGGKKALEEIQIRDRIKEKYCLDNNIRLVRIKYDENIFEILEKSRIFTNNNLKQS